jgi:hypothetical protein
MTPLYLFLVTVPVSLLGIIAFIVMIAVGIRKGDRSRLTSPARTRLDKIARRMTGVGVRYENNDKGGE